MDFCSGLIFLNQYLSKVSGWERSIMGRGQGSAPRYTTGTRPTQPQRLSSFPYEKKKGAK